MPQQRSRLTIAVLVAALLFALACASDDGGEASSGGDSNGATSSAGDGDGDGDGGDGGEPAAPAGDCKATPDDQDLDTKAQDLYAGRPDTQSEDHEAEVGNCVRVAGYTAYVNSAELKPAEFGDPQLVVNVTVRNRDDAAKPFNYFDWKIQTEGGQVLDPTLPMATDNDLGSGDLVTGGEAVGDIAFDAAPGTYYVIYKPDPFNEARGIWQITV